MRAHQSKLQKLFPLWLGLASLFAFIIPAIFGVGGWGSMILAVPVTIGLLVYTAIVTIIIKIRSKFSHYRFSRTMTTMVYALVIAIVTFGITHTDGGDTSESYASLLTKVFGINGTTPDNLILKGSEVIGSVSIFITLVLLVVVFIMAFLDNYRKLKK